MHNCCVGFVLLTSARAGFCPRSEGRKEDTIFHEGCSTESVRNNLNNLKPLSSILPALLFPALWFSYFCVTCSFNGAKLTSLMLKELQPDIFFPQSKDQKRIVREQMSLNMCLGFISCPERTPKHCPSTGAPMFICSSQCPHFSDTLSLRRRFKYIHPTLFFPAELLMRAALVLSLLFWPGSGEARAMAAPASCPWSFTLLLLVVLGQEPHFPPCTPSNAWRVGHGQRGCEKGGRLKVTLPFPICRAE